MPRKPIFYIIAGGLIIAGAIIAVITMQQPAKLPAVVEQPKSTASQPSPASSTPAPAAAVAGAYTAYSEPAFTQAASQTRILFFHASWCPQCRLLDQDIQKQQLPPGVIIFKVDYDTNPALRQKYGVTLQTTLVKVDSSGSKLKSVVAYSTPTYNTVKAGLGL